MKIKTLRMLASLFLAVLLALGGIAPAYADYSNWTDSSSIPTPKAYSGRLYTRTQWMRFYTNYGGADQPRTGTYAVPVGAYYGDVFDDPTANNPNTGWTAIEKPLSEGGTLQQNPPESTTAISGDAINWLDGYLGLNSNLEDPNYWLCSPAFLSGQSLPVPNSNNSFTESSWPFSNDPQGSNQKSDVPVSVGTALPDGSQPFVPHIYSPSNPLAIKNGPDIFQAGAADSNGNVKYAWDSLASTEPAGGQPPCGDINLTQQETGVVMGEAFSGAAKPMTSGYVTASFPYNIMVSSVSKGTDQGSTALYVWYVSNQTPLWLKGITVRVYTHGLTTGTWKQVASYPGIDMPPAAYDSSHSPSWVIKHGAAEDANYPTSWNGASYNVLVQPAGFWSEATPATYLQVTKPNEPYQVVVTADVALNIQNGSLGSPAYAVDTGMSANYWNGAAPTGLPAGETTEYAPLSGMAQSVLGVALPQGYNDNVGYCSDTGGGNNPTPPPTPPPPTNGYNLEAVSLTPSPAINPTQLTFTFTNDLAFPDGGDTEVYFYIQSNDGYLTGYGDGTGPGGSYIVHITPGGTGAVTVSNSQVPFQTGNTVWASVDATSADGVNWTPIEFQGDDGQKYNETTYNDNYTATVIQGNSPQPFVPAAPDMHPTTYPIMDHTITWNKVTIPIIGWQEENIVIPPPPKVRVRLIQ